MKFCTQIRNLNRKNLKVFSEIKVLLNFSLNFKIFLKSFLKLGTPVERLKLHHIPENAIKWPYTNSFDQDLTNQSEQADQDILFLQTG